MFKQLVSLGMVGVMVLSAVVLSLSPITTAKKDNDPKDSSNNGTSVTCDEITVGLGYETKVNTTGDPASVPYTAPEGKLVAAYCVKAGTTAEIVEVTPPQASIDIVAPNGKDVSHYQVLLVDEEVEPIEIALQLAYIEDCAVDEDNTWRVRNPSEQTVIVNYEAVGGSPSGTHEALSGDTFFSTPRGGETMVITWGGGETGIVAGTQSVVAGSDLSSEDPRCEEEVEPTVASVTYRIVPANCEAPASLFYSYENAFIAEQIEVNVIEGDFFIAELPAETEITGPASVELLFIAEKGAEFENGETTFVIEEELEGQLTGEQCVLGEEPEEPVTPVTPVTPEVLPETSGSSAAVVASIIAGVTALIALMGTSVRSLFGRAL